MLVLVVLLWHMEVAGQRQRALAPMLEGQPWKWPIKMGWQWAKLGLMM